MAISFVGALGSQSGVASTRSLTGLTITGSNLAILAATWSDDNTKDVSSVVWDDGSGGSSQTFTQIGTQQLLNGVSGQSINFFILLNPNTSNSRILATFSASSNHSLGADYYSGVAQSSAITDVTQSSDLTSGGSQLNTSDRTGSYQIGTASNENSGVLTFVNTGAVRETYIGGSQILDSNAGITSGSTNTFNWTWTGLGATGWITAMMRPVSTSTNFFIMFQ